MTKSVNQLINFFQPVGYLLTIDARPGQREFNGQLFIYGNRVKGKNVRLHAKGLNLTNVKVNYSPAKIVEFDNNEIELVPETEQSLKPEHAATLYERWGEECDTTIAIEEFTGHMHNTAMHGLYPCYYELSGEKIELLATQFESHHAREVFPCVDEPAAKAKFILQINTAPEFQVLSNMPVDTEVINSKSKSVILQWAPDRTQEEKTPADLTEFCDRRVVFQTTPKMSTYLLAFVIGDLQKFSAKTKRGIDVNIFATKAQNPNSLKFAAEVATRAIDFYEEYFGVEYPLAKSDHVALPDFSSGAMENWGLITYRETALLADKNTSLSNKQLIATVIAHELAHQWFGNLTTMKWWDDLWLNESFASLMEHIAVDALYPEWQVWQDFETSDVIAALRRDALAGVQSVQQDVNHPDEISVLFDSAIVYAKGERLLKMLRAHLSEEIFRAGLRNYFQKFAYKNTVAADLWDCLDEAAKFTTQQISISELMTPWLAQPGYPVVTAELLPSGEIELTQQRFFTDGSRDDTLWPVPLFSNDKNCPAVLSEKSVKFTPQDLTEFRLNIGNNAHFIVKIDEKLRQKSAIKLAELPTIDRVATLNWTSLMARAGVQSAADEIELLKNLSDESSSAVWEMMAVLIADIRKIVEHDESALENLKKLIGNLAAPLFKNLGAAPQKTDDENATKLRAIIFAEKIFAEDFTGNKSRPAIDAALKIYADNKHDLAQINGEIRTSVLAAVVKFAAEEDFAHLLDIYKTSASADLRQDVSAGLTAARASEQIDKLIKLLTCTDIVRPQDLPYWFSWLMNNRFARGGAWTWLRRNWDFINKTFSGDKSYDMFPRIAGNTLRTREELKEFCEFFADLRQEPALKRTIDLGEKDILARAEWIERDFAGVVEKLASI